MVAAIAAARRGADVTVLERMSRVGKKLLATGNGRCNLANTNLSIDYFHGCKPKFALGALDQFNVRQTLSFFDELGIEPCIEEDGKVYPASGQASSVLDVLRYEIQRLGVDVLCNTRISRIEKAGKSFRCRPFCPEIMTSSVAAPEGAARSFGPCRSARPGRRCSSPAGCNRQTAPQAGYPQG